jgi:hypothetical protein
MLGTKYRYFKSPIFEASSKILFMLPTGETDNPDNLVDLPLGDGQTDLELTMAQTYTGINKLDISLAFRTIIQLPDKHEMRVPKDEEDLLPDISQKEILRRDLGDSLETQLSMYWKPSSYVFTRTAYSYTVKSSDRFAGDKDLAYNLLSRNTHSRLHQLNLEIGLSTVDTFLRNAAIIPMEIMFGYVRPLAGVNSHISDIFKAGLFVYF